MRLPVMPARATKVSIPSCDGVAAAARCRSRRFAWPECGTETFLGPDRCGHRRTNGGKGAFGLTPLTCLAPPDADAQTRTTPAPKLSEAQTHLGATREDVKNPSPSKERTLTSEAINLLGATLQA